MEIMKFHRNMNNKEIARLLGAIAAAYEIKGASRFKVIAYDRASTVIEHATSEAKDLWDDGKLRSLPEVGANIAAHLGELFRTGKVRHFERTMRGLPPAMFELLDIPGIGAKTAWKLCEKLKISRPEKAVSRLAEAAIQGKIRMIEGFGEESEANILSAIREIKGREKRISLASAWAISARLVDYMKKEKAVLRIDPLGSLRRMSATVGDIDLAVVTHQAQKAISHFVKYPEIKKVMAVGKNTARLILKNNSQIDLKTQKPEAYGAMLQHYTGSKHHNIHLREIALQKGLSLSEYGIRKVKSQKSKVKATNKKSKLFRFRNEKDFYNFLGMDWIPPELREDAGEIEAAYEKRLPKLVHLKNIKGDLHVHSDFPIEPSHDLGENSMEEEIKKAGELGYEYLAFSEHNPSISKHTDTQIASILERKKSVIEELKCSSKKEPHKINIFNALEVDIHPNGELAISKKALKSLDFVIIAVHSSFRLSRKEMTERILKALCYPKVKILAHPTGRMLEQREGYELDWERIFAYCLKANKILEINSCPQRLDLPDAFVREAVKRGVKMVVNTDAHSLEEMEMMPYGVSVARRGWAEKKDIINTLSYGKIRQWLLE